MAVRLFVGNLPYDTTEDEIRQHFSTVGNLSYVSIPLDRGTGKKSGFGFVEFGDPKQAQEAIRLFNNQPFKGRPLAVNEARAKEARPPGPGGPGGFRPSGPRPPSTGGVLPSGPGGPPPNRDFNRPDPAMDITGRGDRPSRKFG